LQLRCGRWWTWFRGLPRSDSFTLEIPTRHYRYAGFHNSLALCANEEQDRSIVGGAEPRVDLIDKHLPLVRALARRYAGCGEPLDDLVQVGSVGLVAAARRFDVGRGVPFAAYAAPTIEGELRRSVRHRASLGELLAVLQPRERALVLLRFGGDLSQSEIAQRLDISQSQASRLLAAALQKLRRAIETDVGRAA